MNKYWIKSLGEWSPEWPGYSCSYIDDAIKSMENVRKINEELRSDLEEALEIIRYLDEHIINLEKEINKYEDMVTRSKERWG